METNGLDLHFLPMAENNCSHQGLHWWQQQSTGLLHINGFESIVESTKKDTHKGVFLFGGD